MDSESGPMADQSARPEDRLETWAQEFTRSSKKSKKDLG